MPGTLPVLREVQHGGQVRVVAFSPDGKLLASACDDKKVRITRLSDGVVVREVPHGDVVNAVAFSPDGKLLASACHDGKVRVFDAGELAPHAEAAPGAMATPKAAPSAAPPHGVASHSYLRMYG